MGIRERGKHLQKLIPVSNCHGTRCSFMCQKKLTYVSYPCHLRLAELNRNSGSLQFRATLPPRGDKMVYAPERADARANRQRILDAALLLIAERGAGAEIKEVAERAGVGVGTIYRNFATKDDLIRGIIEEMLQRFYEVRGPLPRRR